MINKKRDLAKKREGKVVLKLKTTNVYELKRDELFKYVTNKADGIVYSDKNVTLCNVKPGVFTQRTAKFICTKHPNLVVDIYNKTFDVYNKENGISVNRYEDNTISSKCTLKGLLKRLDRLVARLVSDKHFKIKNGIIYGSHRIYNYIDLKVSIMRYKESIAQFKSELAIIDTEMENARLSNKLSIHKNLKYGDYNGVVIESFSRPIRTLQRKQKECLSNIEKNERQIAIIQKEIDNLKLNNYYASGNH